MLCEEVVVVVLARREIVGLTEEYSSYRRRLLSRMKDENEKEQKIISKFLLSVAAVAGETVGDVT